MSRQPGLSEWIDLVSTHMPHLSVPQARVVALWSYGIALTRSCGRLTVATFLALLMRQKVATVEQRLEWCCDTSHKAGAKRQSLDVTTCFVPLLRWIVTLWTGTHLALALDATTLGARFVVLTQVSSIADAASPWPGPSCPPTSLRLATGMVAPVAGVRPASHTGRCWCWRTAVCGRAGSLGACASGLASAAADQQRGQVLSCWPDTVVLAPRVGPRREPVLVWPGDRLCLAGAAGRLYAGGVVGRGVHGPVVSPDRSGAGGE